ncbi:flippase [Patescibacteria group bacterium]|nr:MAG: flippase [Patescibacteria group bacterium]
MSLTRQIAQNTTIQLTGKAVSVLLGLLAVAILGRALGAEKFGWYVTAAGFLQFIGILCDFGFTVTTASMLAEPTYDKNKLLNVLFSWRFATALVLQGLSPFLIFFFPYPWEIKLAVLVMALSFICVSLNNIFIGWCQNQLKIKIQALGEVIGRLVLVIGLFLLFRAHAGFLPMMLVITISSVVYTAYLWLNAPKVKFDFDGAISKTLFAKIWPLAVAIMFNTIYLQGDRLLLPLYTGQVEVGFYGAAYRVLDIAAQAIFLTMGIMLPLIAYAWSRGLFEEFKKRFQMSIDLVLVIVTPMVAGILALAPPIMRLIAGAEFSQAGPVLRLLSIAILGICYGSVSGSIAIALGRQRQLMKITIIDALLSLAGYLIFIPRYGVWGAAGVTIFSEFFAGIALTIVISRHAGYRPKIKNAVKIFFASALMGLLVLSIQPLNIFLSILIGAAVYAILVWALKIISKQTISDVLLRE